MDFICHMSYFLCLERSVKMRGDCSFCFVDIGGIDDHHCLNFLYIVMNTNVVLSILSRHRGSHSLWWAIGHHVIVATKQFIIIWVNLKQNKAYLATRISKSTMPSFRTSIF